MAYKVSYKVVSEQGEQLKNIAKEMDNYVNRLNQIVSKLGSDELLQSVRGDLNKFKQQLEEEKTILNLAGQVITDVVQNYSGVEKKSVGKVDKAKAHNRDFYKRPVAVASAGGASAGAAGSATAYASSSTVNVGSVSGHTINTTNIFEGTAGGMSGAASSVAKAATAAAGDMTAKGASMAGGIAAAVGSVAAAGGAIAGADLMDKKKAAKKKS